MPTYILGGGNNSLFVSDFSGTILKVSNLGIKTINETKDEVTLEIQAGVDWNFLVELCLEKGYYGLENLIDIPGQVGSAPIQNIGAYGAEAKDVIQSIKFFDISIGDFIEFSREECKFGYRTSIFKTELRGKGIISSVVMKFQKKAALNFEYGNIKNGLKKQGISYPTQRQLAVIIRNIRAAKLPDPKLIGNAGSFFKNPIINQIQHKKLINKFPDAVTFKITNQSYKIAAGWMIDQAGWKGKEMGNVAVHSEQALVLINRNGKASGKEILNLSQRIIKEVWLMFAVKLEPEVNIIGEIPN